MLEFIIGSLYTIVILSFGIILGYFYGAREDKLERRKRKIKNIVKKIRLRGQQSGTVKPKQLTRAEAEKHERQPFENRFQELVGDNPPDDTIGFLE